MDVQGDEMVQVFGHLMKEVVSPGFCLACGACVASCPFGCLEMSDEGPKLMEKCRLCGICYDECSQVVDPKEIRRQVFGTGVQGKPIGNFEQALSVGARHADIKARAQDGGAVTSLLASLLDEGFIDGAVVMGVGESPWKPVPRVATTRKELIECAGTKYSRGPLFLGLRDAVDMYHLSRVALVGTPCQITAARRMQLSRHTNRRLGEAIKICVGLFCGGAFDYNFFVNVIGKHLRTPLEEVEKFDIKRGRFTIYLGRKPRRELALDEVKLYVYPPCKLCSDFSAELADISVGAVGSPLGRSTVLLRTKVGVEAFETAKKLGELDILELERVKPSIRTVEKVAGMKGIRAAKELEILARQGRPLPVRLGGQPVPKEEPRESKTRIDRL